MVNVYRCRWWIITSDAIKYLDLLNSKDLSSYDYISAQNEYVNNEDKLIKLLGNGADWKTWKRYSLQHM